jgi:DNA primase
VPRIARQSIDQVQAAADLVEIVGHYTQLKKSGANFMGCCPFHEEKTPSFSVNPVEKLYYCFGCGEGGNLFSFVQRKENLDFAQAVEHLADKYGIALEYEESSAKGEAERRRRDRLRTLLEQATAYYERVLWEAKAAAPAREYLEGRGLGAEVCRRFRVGFALPGWERLRDAAGRQGFGEQELLDAGLVVPGRRGGVYDRFRARVVFPLADDRGRTLGFGARTMGDEKPKYLNSPETPLYHKSEALFGLHNAKSAAGREDRVYVVEGYTDVLALVQAGVENVVASMGTALTEQQLKRLARLSRDLFLCFDADAAGVGAMSRALSLARRLGLSLHVVRMPAGLDPADYVLSGAGADGFRELAARSETLLQFHVRLALEGNDLSRPDGRAQAFAQLRGVLAEAATPIERDEELRTIADRLRLSDESVRYLLSGSAPAAARGPAAPAPAGGAGRAAVGPAAAALGGVHELEVRLLAACLALPAKGREVLAGVDDGAFASAETRAACRWLKARLASAEAGNNKNPAEYASDAQEVAGDVVAEVVLRSGSERFTAAVVDELFLRLQEAQVGRLIARLKAGAGTDETGVREAKLAELESVRRRLREAIRTLPVIDDPHEGQGPRT